MNGNIGVLDGPEFEKERLPLLPALVSLKLSRITRAVLFYYNFKPLFAALPRMAALRQLSLQVAKTTRKLGESGYDALVGALRSLPELTHLDLTACRGGTCPPASGALLAHYMPPKLVFLSLAGSDSSNCHGDSGIAALAPALQRTPELLELYLDWNGFGAGAAEALARALPSVPHLQVLSLAYNRLGAPGAMPTLARALPSLPNLQRLILASNALRLQPASAAPIAEALRTLRSLQLFTLCGAKRGTNENASALRVGPAGEEEIRLALTSASPAATLRVTYDADSDWCVIM